MRNHIHAKGCPDSTELTIVPDEANFLRIYRRAVLINRPGAPEGMYDEYDEYGECGESENRNEELK